MALSNLDDLNFFEVLVGLWSHQESNFLLTIGQYLHVIETLLVIRLANHYAYQIELLKQMGFWAVLEQSGNRVGIELLFFFSLVIFLNFSLG